MVGWDRWDTWDRSVVITCAEVETAFLNWLLELVSEVCELVL
jgi:hypothetical protein